VAENPASAEVIQAWLVAKLSERLGIDAQEIDIREPFASYGLGSTEAVSLAGELAAWLGRKLSPGLIYEYPTIEALSRYLAGLSEQNPPADGAGPDRPAMNEPIAIIGIGCRFPGANGPAEFWTLLRDGVDAIGEVPPDRFDQHAFYDPDPTVPGKMNTRWGGFLGQVDQFDPNFFGISPREAVRMDPQQRFLLELTWEALQDAGQVPERLAGTPVSVFVGIATNDYGRQQWNDLERIDAYAGTGNALSIAANRISYLFDFRGPSLAVDTACSSSLVAIHLACSSLRNGESTLALAGGVNLILSPAIAINFTKAGAMAPDGRCKAFDARANGYVRSEGAGVVVLKPLAAALADNDPIYAVIRGSAVNQDGRSNGLMAPNPLAQEAVLQEAYRQAGVSPGDVQYVEAHGTGTLLGDPIEAKALAAVLRRERPAGRRCAVGSVKTNLGHLEAAAGVAGLIKVALALHHREIPPSLHFEIPNPHIPFAEIPLSVQTALTPWPAESSPALAGISSFGFGGTNAHVVLEEAPATAARTTIAESKIATHLLPLSARSPEALRSLARCYENFLAGPACAAALPDICYTASARLSHNDYRLAVTGNSPEQLQERLEAFLQGEARPGLSSGRKHSARRRKLVFVFPGQGSQWFGMGRRLLAQEVVFREVIERCDQAMRAYGDWSLLAELSAADGTRSRLNDVDVIQPAVFAVQIGLAALWRSWGIEPQAVVGHSLGEVAAAYVAGVLSLEDAVRVVCHRSRLFKSTIGKGAMAAVELSLDEAKAVLADGEDRISIAASNGPTSTVLSGDPAALSGILDRLQRNDTFWRMLKVDFASHSPQMEPLRAELVRALDGLAPRAGSLPIYSTVTGQIGHGEGFDPLYWARNMREPVLFSGAVQRLVEDGHDIFLEISPHPGLLGAMQQGFHHLGYDAVALPSMRREEDERAVMQESLGALYTLGYPVNWDAIYPRGGRWVRLPAYPWQRERYWLESPLEESKAPQMQTVRDGTGSHALLGQQFSSPHSAGTHFWEATLDKNSLPYLGDHRIQGVAVLPASTYVAITLAAADAVFGARTIGLRDIEFRKALFLQEDGSHRIQVVLSQAGAAAPSFHIYSRPNALAHTDKPWVLHATGNVDFPQDEEILLPDMGRQTPAGMRAQSAEKIAGEDYYRRLGESGIHYGPYLRCIEELWRGNAMMLGEVRVPDGPEAGPGNRQIHPAILDAGLQVLAAAVAAEAQDARRQGIYLPTRISRLQVHGRPGSHLWAEARADHLASGAATGDVRLVDEAGNPAIEIQGLRFEYLGEDTQPAAVDNANDWLYEFVWQPKDLAVPGALAATMPASWLIFMDSKGVGDALSTLLDARGDRTILVTPGESYEKKNAAHYRIRPDRPEDVKRLLESALGPDQPRCRGIIHLWSLEAPGPGEISTASLDGSGIPGSGNVLLLVQGLARVESANLPRLWLVTHGAQAIGEGASAPSVAQSPLWGLGRVIAQEHPTFWGGLVDLESGPSVPAVAAQQLGQEILGGDAEDQIAFREGRRYVARLVRRQSSAAAVPPFPWRTDGSYLISGGLGDLGLLVARWMVEQGARRLILLGRTKLPARSGWNSIEAESRLARQIAAIRELESAGATVHLAPVDVADEAELKAFLGEFRAQGWPPIRGVVHAAGVLQDGLLVQLDGAAMRAVLRPKVTGGWLLHRLLQDAPLDFFVLFSSAGSVLGQPGQGNYAAANAFLDALAHHRQAQGLPALSINWGAWAGEGFADSVGGRRLAARLALLGISSIVPRRALEMLGQLLGQRATQVVAVPVNWKQYREFYPAGSASPLLSELAQDSLATPRASNHTSARREALLAAGPAEREQMLQSYVSEQVARVLGVSPSKLDPQQPLNQLGLDSLMAVELKNRIAVDLKVNVPVVRFLDGFSVDQAVAQVLGQLAAETTNPVLPLASAPLPAGERENAERLLAKLGQLSDEQVGSLLADMLGEGKDRSMSY
jgi:acyl transferase domain-containing protein/acyl carrier protein